MPVGLPVPSFLCLRRSRAATPPRAQADEGIEHVIVNLPDAHVLERLETFGREIIPAVA